MDTASGETVDMSRLSIVGNPGMPALTADGSVLSVNDTHIGLVNIKEQVSKIQTLPQFFPFGSARYATISFSKYLSHIVITILLLLPLNKLEY